MTNNTENYSVLIKAFIIAILLVCAYLVTAGNSVEEVIDETETALLQEAVSKKGQLIIRAVNLTDHTVYCVVVDESTYYYNSFKIRKNRAGKWYLRPESDEFIWWCK